MIFVLLAFFRSLGISITASQNLKDIFVHEIILLSIVVLYIGLRPIDYRFGDMGIYNNAFERYVYGMPFNVESYDIVFEWFMFFSAQIMSASLFFFICALLYIIPLWLACKKWFKRYSFYALLFLVSSFSFWTYGVNGIRNGIATSLFVFALSRDKITFKIILIIISIGIHKSLAIPTAGFLLTYFNKNPIKYFYGWFACIFLSLIAGGFWESLFAGLMDDNRAAYLTTYKEEFKESFSSNGFRWDFVIYSFAAIFCAYFFCIKKKFKDPIYNQLVCIYIAANGFWILVIRASFSNRFAYLSWFMMGIVIVYPFLKKIQIKQQHRVLGLILLLYFSFTFIMNVALSI